MTLKETDEGIGERIRARRLDLGVSLRAVAGQAQISHSTLSRIENGKTPASNRFELARIAAALHCHTDVLTGVVVPGGKDRVALIAATYDTVHALLDSDLEFPVEPAAGQPVPIQRLREQVDGAITRRQRCDYTALTRQLPQLVRWLYQATAGPDRAEALGMLVRVAEAASFAVRYTGDPRNAVIASDRARQAAVELGDPVLLSFGEWARAHSALGCGLHERAVQIARKALTQLDAAPAAPGRLEMLGMLYLTLAFSLVGADRTGDAEAPLAEAAVLAERTGETDTLALMFGPTNLRLWELAIITDGGDPVDALPIIAETNPLIIPSQSRQVCFYTDAARTLARLGQYDRAVKFFEVAEGVAPQRVHGDPIVIESVRGLLETVRQRAVSHRLRGLAQRVGAAS